MPIAQQNEGGISVQVSTMRAGCFDESFNFCRGEVFPLPAAFHVGPSARRLRPYCSNSRDGVAVTTRSTTETTAPTPRLPLLAMRLFCEQLRQVDINVTEIAFLFTREPCR